jgi:hypothetical protein
MNSIFTSLPKMPATRDVSSLPDGFHEMNAKSLRQLFNKLCRRNPELNRFRKYFKKDPITGFYLLDQSNMNYPSAHCSTDSNGNQTLSYQFNDAKGHAVYVAITFPKDGEYYYFPSSFEFRVYVNGEYESYSMKVDDCYVELTKEQVLDMFFRFLGELVLIRFLDFFVDMGYETPYDKLSIINTYFRKLSKEFNMSFDKKAKKITVNSRKPSARRTSLQHLIAHRVVMKIVKLFY